MPTMVQKYGCLPDSPGARTYSAKWSASSNVILSTQLRSDALQLRKLRDDAKAEDTATCQGMLQHCLSTMMNVIYRMLCLDGLATFTRAKPRLGVPRPERSGIMSVKRLPAHSCTGMMSRPSKTTGVTVSLAGRRYLSQLGVGS